MTVLTEGQHKGEFLVQEFGGISREVGTYASGASVIADGTVLKTDTNGQLVAVAGFVDSSGDSEEAIVGIALGDIDVTDGAVDGPYIARLAVVNSSLLTIPGANDSAVIAALAGLMIIAR